MRVPQPKLEHIGKGERVIPMFPELHKALMDVYTEAEPGTEYVITRYRDLASNLRTHFMRLIRRAGLTPWPKLWHNLRASRQTELSEVFPMHVVCQWIGNTGAVAMEHYLQTLDTHFAKAIAPTASAAQNAAHSTLITAGKGRELAKAEKQNRPEIPSDSTAYKSVPNSGWPLSESNRYAREGDGF